MSNVEQFPASSRQLTEYEALIAAAPSALDAFPGAVYLCDSEGWLVRYNSEAVQLWGRQPDLETTPERFCGSHRLYTIDGTPLAHHDCPMAAAVREGTPTRNAEVIMERLDGSRFMALVNIRALRNHKGQIQGAINCFQDVSALKAMEAELVRKNQDLEDFFENSAVGLHIVSGDGIILRANKAELDMLGYTAEEYVGRHIAEFHADSPVIGDILQRLSCGERLNQYPARLRAKDGSIKSVLITSNGRFDDGLFVNTRCFTTNVTELYEAEVALRESQERLTATYEAATVGIAETDESGRYIRVNDALCRILNRSREELLNTRFMDISHPNDRDEDAGLYARQVTGELPNYELRKRALRPDGSIAYLDVSSSSVRDEQGRFRYGVRVMQDVTERKRMQDQLRASEQQMRELLEALPAAIYKTDSAGRVTFYNQACIDFAGREPQLGTDHWCVTWRLHWPDGTPMRHDECPMAIALNEGRPIRGGEAIAERPDGTMVPFIAYPTPLRDADGAVIGAINMLIDITSQKEAEARQKALIGELNHRVKNTLTTVQSLAGQTARHVSTVGEFTESFEARLLALAKAHDLLTRRYWTGVALDGLIQEIISPFGDGEGRVEISGPVIDLSPQAALSLTMAMNELATNASKYGALSGANGRVSISWCLREKPAARELEIEWLERGGPEVVPPRRRSFGMRLIERCVEGDLDGELDFQFAPAGVYARMTLPLASVAAHA
ncbi:PAS domain S-box protein [Chelatococcus sp. GCM10030263]|uniref:PAS domain-containing sensor histidine kinase n=1 Tax=Chelatococcus sp. GCM10030263 TaxID=3273387 RepID=UPI00361A0582